MVEIDITTFTCLTKDIQLPILPRRPIIGDPNIILTYGDAYKVTVTTVTYAEESPVFTRIIFILPLCCDLRRFKPIVNHFSLKRNQMDRADLQIAFNEFKKALF